jgi:hypothetical protein
MKRIANAALLAAIVACSESTSPDQQFTGGGPTTFRLTDAPFPYDKVASVDIFVVKVQASWAGDTSAAATNDFVTVANVNRKINLLALEGGLSDQLGTANIPKGAIKAVRLIIDTDQSSITMKTGQLLTGSSNPGIQWQSSAGIATLNAEVTDHIDVPEEGTDVVLDFDVGRAFIDPADVTPPCGCAGFIFSPVVRAAQVSRTGSISGTVRLGSASGPVGAEATVELKLGNPNSPSYTWATLSTARADANGVFKFAYVNRSTFYTDRQPSWSYMVVATKASGQSGAKTVIVVAGADNPAGVIVVPQS